jgi:hypothetical protein
MCRSAKLPRSLKEKGMNPKIPLLIRQSLARKPKVLQFVQDLVRNLVERKTVGPGSPNETLDDMADDEETLAVLHIPRLMRRLLAVVGEDQELSVVSVEPVQVM